MKKFLFIIFIGIAGSAFSSDPDHHLHLALHHLFKASHPEARHVIWNYLPDGLTEVDYMSNEHHVIQYYDREGKIVETDQDMTWFELPRQARNFIYDHFEGCFVQQFMNVTHGTEKYYKVVLNYHGLVYRFTFSEDGNIMGGYTMP